MQTMKLALLAGILLTLPGFGQNVIRIRADDKLLTYDTTGTLVGTTSGLPLGNWGSSVDSSGNLWTTNFEAGNNTVTKIDPAGTIIGSYPAGPPAPGNGSTVGPLAIDSFDRIYIGDPGGNTVTVLDSSGANIGGWTVQGNEVRTIAVDLAGDIWLTVYAGGLNATIQKYDLFGNLLWSSVGGAWYPNSVFADEFGRVVVSHWPNTDKTTVFALDGTVLDTISTYVVSSHLNSAVAPNGNYFITGYNGVTVVSPDGTILNTDYSSYPGVVSFDGVGVAWVIHSPFSISDQVIARRYTLDGTPLGSMTVGNTVPLSLSMFNVGDITGATRLRVALAHGDNDLDGYKNREETMLGTNPLDVLSFPSSPALSSTMIPQIGTSYQMALTLPFEANRPYVCPLTLNPSGFPLLFINGSDPRILPVSPIDLLNPLAIDPLWLMSLDPAYSFIFNGTAGTLDALGTATITINIPNLPSLVGFSMSTFAYTLDSHCPTGLRAITEPHNILIQ